ncbi:phage-related protein [Bordetella avium 197N]|uniref:Phage-related protein n=2 Tax=Bordetella avium TaxID=521 RepID=Q2KZ19_BORA1|nr:phage-related protein [Bordetella avium 197N]
MVSVGLSYWRVDCCVEPAEAPFLINGTVLDLQAPLLLTKLTRITGGAGTQTLSGRISNHQPYFAIGAVQVLPQTSLMVPGYRLARLTGVVGGGLQGQGISSTQLPVQAYHFRSVGEYKEVQLQAVQDGLAKMVKVRFAGQSEGIVAGVVYAKDADAAMLGADFDVIEARDQPASSSYQDPGYGCVGLVLDGIPARSVIRYELDTDAVLTVSGDNDYSGSTFVVSGTVRAGSVNAFGGSQVVVMRNGTLDKAGLRLSNKITNRGGVILG